MSTKTIFLDRDGVINKEKNYLFKISEFEFIDGIFDACRYFISINFNIIVITNQSGIERGLYTEIDFNKLNIWMINEFKKNNVEILDVFHCPHVTTSNCNCRKPKPGMLIEAQIKHEIDLSKSWMIGDKESDIKAAKSAGVDKTILLRSGHKVDETFSDALFIKNSIIETVQIIK